MRLDTPGNDDGSSASSVAAVGDVDGDGRDDLLTEDRRGNPIVLTGSRGSARLTLRSATARILRLV